MTGNENDPHENRNTLEDIDVGDLVRVSNYDWITGDLGIVTEVREIVHDMSGDSYTAVTALIGKKEYTFSQKDFLLVSKAERKIND